MPHYTFFPCQDSGTASTFNSFELSDDTAAYQLAANMLREHRSAAYVAVWCGERQLRSAQRTMRQDRQLPDSAQIEAHVASS